MFAKSKDDIKAQTARTGGGVTTPSIIGADVEIEGHVKTAGEVQLDGSIIGDLTCSSLVMGETGSISGMISAETATIRGQVSGDIRAKTVRLEKSARVEGDVYHASLTVEAGAKLTGTYTNLDNPLSQTGALPAPSRDTDTPAPDFLKAPTAAE